MILVITPSQRAVSEVPEPEDDGNINGSNGLGNDANGNQGGESDTLLFWGIAIDLINLNLRDEFQGAHYCDYWLRISFRQLQSPL